MENLLNLEFQPITMPEFENSLFGIKRILCGLLFIRQTQAKKSIGFFLFRLKTQIPILFSRLFHKLQDFTSILIPFKFKSAPRLNIKCSAPSKLATNLSHLKPIPLLVFQNSLSFVKYERDLAFFIRQALFPHNIEQYFGRFLSFGALQIKHFIFSLYYVLNPNSIYKEIVLLEDIKEKLK